MRLSLFSLTAVAAVLAFAAPVRASIIVKTPIDQTSPQQTNPGVKNGIILQNHNNTGASNNGIILQNNTHAAVGTGSGAGLGGGSSNGSGSPSTNVEGSTNTGTPNPNHQASDDGSSNGGSAGPGGGPNRTGAKGIVSPRDHASGLPTGKRMHKPVSIKTHTGLGTHVNGDGHGPVHALGPKPDDPSGAAKQATGGDDGGGDGGNAASHGIIIEGHAAGGLGTQSSH